MTLPTPVVRARVMRALAIRLLRSIRYAGNNFDVDLRSAVGDTDVEAGVLALAGAKAPFTTEQRAWAQLLLKELPAYTRAYLLPRSNSLSSSVATAMYNQADW